MQITWLATAFAFGSALFWFMSMCCCSGRTSRVMGDTGKKRGGATKIERTPYTYERVASPYIGGSESKTSVPMQPYGQTPAYEPMRHQQV